MQCSVAAIRCPSTCLASPSTSKKLAPIHLAAKAFKPPAFKNSLKGFWGYRLLGNLSLSSLRSQPCPARPRPLRWSPGPLRESHSECPQLPPPAPPLPPCTSRGTAPNGVSWAPKRSPSPPGHLTTPHLWLSSLGSRRHSPGRPGLLDDWEEAVFHFWFLHVSPGLSRRSQARATFSTPPAEATELAKVQRLGCAESLVEGLGFRV